MAANLIVRAGSVALARLRDGGLRSDDVTSMIGASGGPKWLVLSHIDRVLEELVIAGRTEPLAVLGSSIGTFRHLCHAQRDPVAAIDRFEHAYIAQAYEAEPTAREVTAESRRIIDVMFGDDGRREVLANDMVHTHFVASRSKTPVASDARVSLTLGLGAAAIANAVSRRLLAGFFERVVFHTASPRFRFPRFGTRTVPLTMANLDAAALASGSIPLVMDGIDGIAGARPGRHRDGGIIDYHFDFEFDAGGDGLILYPHFFDRITPGWFDKALPWRRPIGRSLERTVLIAPSADFIQALPGGRGPDRVDFRELPTAERQRRWHDIVDRCRVLADDLVELWTTGRLGAVAQPFPPV